jgi:hypothetical protein
MYVTTEKGRFGAVVNYNNALAASVTPFPCVWDRSFPASPACLTNRLTCAGSVRNWPFRGCKNRLYLIGIADIEEHSLRKLIGHFSWFKIDHKQRASQISLWASRRGFFRITDKTALSD